MSDAIWYYAHGDKEQGPVSIAQLKALIQSAKLVRDDLVWKDGMDDWVAAGTVPGLFTSGEAPLADAPAPAGTAPAGTAPAPRTKAPAAAAPRIEAPARPPGNVGANPAPPPAAAPPATPAAAADTSATGVRLSLPTSFEPRKVGRWAGWGLLIVGLFLVLTAKGCDSLGRRYVASMRAAVDSGVGNYQSKDVTASEASYHSWSLGRELLFLAASLLLLAGLIAAGLSGEGPEKWICLIMLAIITYSLFVGGSAWSGGLPGR